MIYEPREDSFLLEEAVNEQVKHGMKVLDLGTGSGILGLAAKALGGEVLAVDINPEAVERAESLGLKALRSDIFENVEGRYDAILFNPPYLPDCREDPDPALDGGPSGGELTLRFLREAKGYLGENGFILLLLSSLGGEKDINLFVKENYGFEKLKTKSFSFEKIHVYKLWVK